MEVGEIEGGRSRKIREVVYRQKTVLQDDTNVCSGRKHNSCFYFICSLRFTPVFPLLLPFSLWLSTTRITLFCTYPPTLLF